MKEYKYKKVWDTFYWAIFQPLDMKKMKPRTSLKAMIEFINGMRREEKMFEKALRMRRFHRKKWAKNEGWTRWTEEYMKMDKGMEEEKIEKALLGLNNEAYHRTGNKNQRDYAQRWFAAKIKDYRWRCTWDLDWCMSVSGSIAANIYSRKKRVQSFLVHIML